MHRMLLSSVAVFVVCSPIFAEVSLVSAKAAATSADLVLTYEFTDRVEEAYGTNSVFIIRAEGDADNAGYTQPAKAAGKTLAATVPLAKIGDSPTAHVRLRLVDAAGTTVHTTPALVVDVATARASAITEAKRAELEIATKQQAASIDSLKAQLEEANAKLNAQSATLPKDIRFIGQDAALTTPDSTVLRFETWRGGTKVPGRIRVDASQGGVSIARTKGEFTTDHLIQVKTATSPAPRTYKFTAVVLNGQGDPIEDTKTSGEFSLPAAEASVAPVINVTTKTDSGITFKIVPSVDSLVQLIRLEGDKPVFLYGDPLETNEWNFPERAKLRKKGEPVQITAGGLQAGKEYRFQVVTMNAFGDKLTTPYSDIASTAPAFDYVGAVTMEINQLGYKVQWQATAPPKTGAFRLNFPKVLATEWMPATISDKTLTATVTAAELTKLVAAGGGFPIVELKMSNEQNVERVRDIQVKLTVVETKDQIKQLNPAISSQDLEKTFKAVQNRKSINWGQLALTGLKALLVALP